MFITKDPKISSRSHNSSWERVPLDTGVFPVKLSVAKLNLKNAYENSQIHVMARP